MWQDETTWEKVARRVESLRDDMVELQKKLCAIPAISPVAGGEGELAKEQFLKEYVSRLLQPDHLSEVNAPDPRAASGIRPTLVVKWKGADSSRTVWFLTHTDVVPPGDLGLWKRSPWEAYLENGNVIGRGVEDNQQSLVGSIFAVHACRQEGLRFPVDVGLMFMADEENGSALGMEYVLQHADYFKPEDVIVVPDGGSPDGADVEVAEKSGVWVAIQTHGKQCHAAMPEKGVNAFRAGSALVASLESLYQEFPQSNPLFSPPISTFEPTKKEANVPNVNTIPGEDVFYVDCRILPEVPVQGVLDAMRRRADEVERRYGVKVDVVAGRVSQAAPPTPVSAPVVKLYGEALRKVYGVEARAVGIGGGTVAAFLRHRGYPAAVVGRNNGFAHQPNEACEIANLVGDAKVFAYIMGAV